MVVAVVLAEKERTMARLIGLSWRSVLRSIATGRHSWLALVLLAGEAAASGASMPGHPDSPGPLPHARGQQAVLARPGFPRARFPAGRPAPPGVRESSHAGRDLNHKL